MTYTRCFSCFDLAQIADSGQCFRMARLPERELSEHDRCYRIISDGKLLFIRQNGSSITFDCNSEEELTFWLHYFDCEQDYEHYLCYFPAENHSCHPGAGGGLKLPVRYVSWGRAFRFSCAPSAGKGFA